MILFLQESKLKSFDNRVISSLGGLGFLESFPVPWCFGGDFNSVLDPSERSGGVCLLNSLKNFNAFVLKAKVVDLLMQGFKFTWSNRREKASWARLDRFLISPLILSWFPNLVQKSLPCNLSDHNAIIIKVPLVDWGHIPFWFFNGWLEDKALIASARKKVEGLQDAGFYRLCFEL
ncbi:hypothetical protein Dsin_028716 [Dipteronia sinensis]|uniref:Endonuclease/exonuclease/phosphatase domain-containing protein n=1 Tax=Dipteronia sinensis TaxID=43782 RepID=A0AAD9ZRT1_9ROSI|nr:hypothetical protein Dsin_028716 [Dipteronia sinensis]